jgi:hypothetical protein
MCLWINCTWISAHEEVIIVFSGSRGGFVVAADLKEGYLKKILFTTKRERKKDITSNSHAYHFKGQQERVDYQKRHMIQVLNSKFPVLLTFPVN